MSYAANNLLSTLHFDPKAGTLYISTSIKGLEPVGASLRRAFGSDAHIPFTRASMVTPAPEGPGKLEMVALQGIAAVFGDENREVYMEFGLYGGEIQTMLMLIPLPEKSWELATGFQAIERSPTHPDLRLRKGMIVVSHGLEAVDGVRTVKDIDQSAKNRSIQLSGYPLQDGLQILADGLVNAEGALDAQIWAAATDAQIPAEILPNREKQPNPDRVEIRADVDAGWLQLEAWWDEAPPLEGTSADGGFHAAGLAIRYDLNNWENSRHFWLRAIGTTEAPVVMEAMVSEGIKPRFSSRNLGRMLLGNSATALEALIGAAHSELFSDLGLELPESLSLISFTYAPKEWIMVSVGIGTEDKQNAFVINTGPFELKEAVFSLFVPLQNNQKPSVELDGKINVFDEDFRVHLRPWALIEGGLDDPRGVHLGELIQQILPVELPFGLDTISLRHAWLRHESDDGDFHSGNLSLNLELDGKIELLPGMNGALTLDSVGMEITLSNEEPATGSIHAALALGPLSLVVSASHEADGWTFDGNANAENDGISLTALVDHLVQLFGAAVPHEIPDVKLESVSLNYQTATRSLDIMAVTNWEIPEEVPVLGNSRSRVALQLLMTPDAQQGGRTATFSISWNLKKERQSTGTPDADPEYYELNAQAFLSGKTQSFAFDFQAPEEHPLTLSEAVHDLGLPDIPKPAAGVLDAILQVSSLSMNITRPDNLIEVAWTRDLGDGVLLLAYNQSKDTASSPKAVMNRHLEASWLGNEEDDTIGIDNVLELAGHPEIMDEVKTVLNVVGLEHLVEEMLTFKQLGFVWEESGSNHLITFTALSTYRTGAHSFVMARTGENAGIVAGISFDGEEEDQSDTASTGKLDFLPEGVKTLLEVAKEVISEVELTHLILSTIDSNTFQAPAFSSDIMLPDFAREGDEQPSYSFGSDLTTLNKGLSVGARVKFDKKGIIHRLVDIDELDAQLTLGEVIALKVSIPGRLTLDAGGGNSLKLTAPAIQIKENLKAAIAGPELSIIGGLDLQLFGHRLDVSGWMALAEESITGHIQIKELPFPIPISPASYLQGVQLVISEKRPLSLELGLQFEPPGLDLGLSGSFAIYKDKDTRIYGDAAFVMEIIEEAPNPLYVEFALEEMSLPILLEAITGIQYRLHQADDLLKLAEKGAELVSEYGPDATKGAADAAAEASKTASASIEAVESAIGHIEAILSKVELQKVRMYWADSLVNLPDGTTAMPGAGIRGALSIFDWDAYAEVDFSSSGTPGFTGHFECEPIEIGGVVRIWGDGKGIPKDPKTAADINKQISEKIAAQAKDLPAPLSAPVDQLTPKWLLEPGGPVLHLSTRSSPFLHADLHAELFGFLQTDIHADITDEGFDFDFNIRSGNALHADLECHWWHKDGRFEAHGDLGVHLKGEIGPIVPGIEATKIQLDTDLDAHISLVVDSQKINFVVNGSFAYQGASLSMPELVLDVQIKSLEDLVKAIWDHIKGLAKDIFEEVLAPIGKFVADAAKEVAHVAVEAAKEVADVAVAAAKEAKQMVADTAEAMGKAVQDIGQAAADLSKKAEEITNQAAEKALEAATPMINAAKELGDRALEIASETAVAIKAIVDDVEAVMAEAAHYAIDMAEQAAHWVAQRLDDARRWVTTRLNEAAEKVRQLALEAENAVRNIEAEIENLANEIANIANEIENFLKRAEHSFVHAVSFGFL